MKSTPKKTPASRGKTATAKARPGAASIRHRPQSEKSPPAPGGTPPAPSPSGARGRRTSVNLYDSDLDLLEPLRVALRASTGLRVIRDSSLVQVVCRVHGKPGPEHVAALREVLALDGRH